MDWWQWSRQLWLRERDANTRFFHAAANGLRQANYISRLIVGDQEATRDVWVWRQPRFSAKATYRLLCGQMPPEDPHIIQRCRLVLKRRIPLKIRIFRWLLLRQRLMTRVMRQRMLPATSVSCPLCDGGPEDLLPPLLSMPVGSGGMEGGRGSPPLRDICGGPPLCDIRGGPLLCDIRGGPLLCDIRGGILEIPIGGFLLERGRLEADFCHFVSNLDPPERGCLYGSHPVRRCHYTHYGGVLFFLAPRRRMPLELCTPATIDLAVSFH